MNTLRVLSGQGDECVTWDVAAARKGDLDEQAAIAEAQRIFDDVRARGGMAFEVRPDQLPIRMKRFDPAPNMIILVPPVVGG